MNNIQFLALDVLAAPFQLPSQDEQLSMLFLRGDVPCALAYAGLELIFSFSKTKRCSKCENISLFLKM
jgi:hypothetical protein